MMMKPQAVLGIMAALALMESEGGEKCKPAEPPKPLARQPAGRNAPCPCGSGKKFKRCCKE